MIFNDIIEPKHCNFHIFKKIEKPPINAIPINIIEYLNPSCLIFSGSTDDKELTVLPNIRPTKGDNPPYISPPIVPIIMSGL